VAAPAGYVSTIYYKETAEGLRPFFIPTAAKIIDAKPVTAEPEAQPEPEPAEASKRSVAVTIPVVVTVHEAHQLSSSFLDKTDAYVKVNVGTHEKKTRTKDNAGHHAVWTEFLTFAPSSDENASTVAFAVYDEDTLSDDLLGRGSVPLRTSNYVVDLTDEQGRPAGQLFVSVSVSSQDPGPFDIPKAPASTLLEQAKEQIQEVVTPKGVDRVPDIPVLVTVSNAQNLPSSLLDKTDPYVRVKVGSQTEKTTTKSDAGKQAAWDEILVFSLDATANVSTVHFDVFDEDTLSDDLIGRGSVPLQTGHYAVPLVDDASKARGVLHVSVSVNNEELPPLKSAKPPTVPVVVAVHDAYNMPSSLLDKTDPYVRVQIGSQTEKTSTKSDAGKQAAWNEHLQFEVDPTEGLTSATVEVYDEDTVSDDLIGRAAIPLQTGNYTVDLTDKASGKSRGSVRVSVSVNHEKPPALENVVVKEQVAVTIVRGWDMPSSLLDKTDPYVKVSFGEESEKTSTKDDAGKQATWNETLTFFVDLTAVTQGVVALYDKDTISDDLLGTNTFPIKTGHYTVDVLDKDQKKGKLLLSVSVDNQPLPAIEEHLTAKEAPKTPVDVTVVRVANLPSSMLDKTDPYVQVAFQTDAKKTSTKEDAGKSAVFQEVLRFDVDIAAVTQGTVSVYDKDTISDDLIGTNTFPLATGVYTLNVVDEGKNKGLVVLIVSVNGETPADLSAATIPDETPAPKSKKEAAPVNQPSANTTHVVVTLVKASGLPSSVLDKADPYVKLTIGDIELKSSVKQDAGKAAEWNEVFDFHADLSTYTTGTASVFDEDTIKDDFIGSASFNLVTGSYTLDIKNEKGKSSGTLVLSVSVPTKEAPAAAAAPAPAPAASTPAAAPAAVKAAGKTVTVTVIEASGLPSSWTDKADPYVKITVNKVTKSSTVKEDAGKQAVWNEQLGFANVDVDEVTTALFEVWEKNEIQKDELIGAGSFHIKAGEQELPIMNKAKQNGVLRLGVKIDA